MLNICIKDEFLYIKSIDKTSISKIYSIYRNSSDFKYATGIFQPIEYTQFSNNISQFIQRENVFFLDIRLYTGETIGIIKGIVIEKDNIAWINSLIIDTPYQSKGFGKKAIRLLEDYLRQICFSKRIYLSVFRNNVSGINFWMKCGFNECNDLPGKEKVRLNETVQIMCKLL